MTFFLNCTVQVSVVLVASLVALRCLRKQPAALRHWVLSVVIACSLLLPALHMILPTWSVPLPLAVQPGGRLQPDSVAASVRSIQPELDVDPKEDANQDSKVVRAQAPLPAASEAQKPTLTLAGGRSPLSWIRIAEGLWATGVVLGFVVLIAGIIQLKWIGRHSRPITEGKWHDITADISRDYGLGRSVDLLQSRYPSMLATWGAIRPAILLPVGANDWNDDRIHLVLAHEIAHVRRHDWLVQLIAEVFRTIYWFNPLAWIVCARLCQESEQACDDSYFIVAFLAQTTPRTFSIWLEVSMPDNRGGTTVC